MIRSTNALRVLTILALGCGGGSSNAPAATTASGDTIQTAGGGAVTVEAHNHWVEGLRMFNQFEEAGNWNEQTCQRSVAKFEEAVAAQGGGRFAEALYMAGLVSTRCDNDSDARRFYTRSLEAADEGREPNSRPPANGPLCKARVALGLMDLQGGNVSSARSAFQRAVRDDPQCTSGYVNLAILQRNEGGAQEQEALNNLRRALAIESDYLPAFNQMALLYYARGLRQGGEAALDLAEVVCRQAQLIDRNYAAIYNTWGLVKIRKGNVIDALRYFEKARELDPNMYEAQMNFAQITLSFRGYEDAKSSFERAVQLKSNSYEAHLGLGAALRGLEQFDAAKAEYERAREIDGNRPEAYFNLGVLYHDYISAANTSGLDGTIRDLNTAKGFYEQFLGKAGSNDSYTEAVEGVQRRCRRISERARRARSRRTRPGQSMSEWRGGCRPGRLQLIEETINALREAEEMQREAEQMQREAEQMQREAEQQQQQQQQSEGEGGE